MCPSEVSDIESTLWQEYQDQGVVVWGVASDDDLDTLLNFRDQMGITFPILHDEDGAVHAQYAGQTEFAGTRYPEDWVVGSDGTIKYYNGAYDAAAITAIIEAELAQ